AQVVRTLRAEIGGRKSAAHILRECRNIKHQELDSRPPLAQTRTLSSLLCSWRGPPRARQCAAARCAMQPEKSGIGLGLLLLCGLGIVRFGVWFLFIRPGRFDFAKLG